jgi:hypothetical protein
MSDFRVISAGLNLRSSGIVAPDNIIAVLPQGQIVTRIGSESDSEKWWQVRTILGGRTFGGFVSKSFLDAVLDQFSFLPPNSSFLVKNSIFGQHSILFTWLIMILLALIC